MFEKVNRSLKWFFFFVHKHTYICVNTSPNHNPRSCMCMRGNNTNIKHLTMSHILSHKKKTADLTKNWMRKLLSTTGTHQLWSSHQHCITLEVTVVLCLNNQSWRCWHLHDLSCSRCITAASWGPTGVLFTRHRFSACFCMLWPAMQDNNGFRKCWHTAYLDCLGDEKAKA